MKKLLILIFVGAFLLSCKKDIYHDFTEDEKAFLVYNVGDTFKLKDENSGEITTFNITSKSIDYKKDTGPTAGGRKTHYMEEGRLEFSCQSGCLSPPNEPDKFRGGYIYI